MGIKVRTIIKVACVAVSGAALLAACSGKPGASGAKTSSTTSTTTSATAAAAAPAAPKVGLWEMTAAAEGMPGPMKTKMCIGAPEPGSTPFAPPPQPGQTCAKRNVVRTATGYTIDVECAMNGMTLQTTGEVSGDFASSFKTVTTTKMSGANVPAQMQTAHTSTVEARYLGACPAGVKPGMVSRAG